MANREHRLQRILDQVAATGAVTNQDLEGSLAVSGVTLRRDLDELQRRGLLRRVHGGAVRVAAEHDPGFAVREQEGRAAKTAIGRTAAALIADGATCYLDAGTTPVQVAHALRARGEQEGLSLQILTPAADIALALAPVPSFAVHCLGGRFNPGTHSATGPEAVAQLAHYHVDIAVIGVTGVHPGSGWTNTSPATVDVKQAALAAAERRVVVADAGKWQRTNFYRIAPWSGIHEWVCDRDLPPTARRRCRRDGIRLHLAEDHRSPS